MQPEDVEFEPGRIETPLPAQTLNDLLAALPGWHEAETGSGATPCLAASYVFDDFVSALAFANRVGELAERYNHHPEITLEYGCATVRWWTHTAGGISINDVVLARETSKLAGSS